MLVIRFHSKPAYDENYIKAKVKTFNSVLNTIFWNDKIPKQREHYTCRAVISIHSVIEIDKKLQRKKIFKFI